MTQTSCISHPANNRRLQIHEWQVLACDGDVCAAGVLSHIECLHNEKQGIDKQHKQDNDIAELHNKSRQFDEDIPLRIKLPELRKAIFGLGAEKKLSDVLNKIALKSFISFEDPEERLDRTKYVRFHPENCNAWIRDNYNNDGSLINHPCKISPIRPKGRVDSAKKENRFGEKGESILPKGRIGKSR